MRSFETQMVAAALAGAPALTLLWPVQPARYLWGVWPLLLLLFVLGAREIWRCRPQSVAARSARAALVVGVVILTAGYARQTVRGVRGRYWENIPRTGGTLLKPIILGVRATTTPDEIVAAPAEVSMYLYTGRRTIPTYTFPVQQLFRQATDAEAACALGEILNRYPASVFVSDDPQQERTAVGLEAIGGFRFVERARLANDVVVYNLARPSRPLACLLTA